MLALKRVADTVVQRTPGLEPGVLAVDLEVGHVLFLARARLEVAGIAGAGQHAFTQALQGKVVLGAQVDAIGLGEAGNHRQRRQGVVVIGQRALLALDFVGQEALVIHLVGAHLVFLHGPVEQVATVGGDGGSHD